jgi:Leu/Phe-tRNA-protein transferase
MPNIQRDIHHLPYEALITPRYLREIYADMDANYYWSDDYSAQYYISQAKAGFIAVTEVYNGQELLLPEMQYDYALLELNALHCSKKVAKLIAQKHLHIIIDNNIEEIAQLIDKTHRNNWLTQHYASILRGTEGIDKNFKIITAYIEYQGDIVAGEIGYIIGKTYTSLSGFSLKEKPYNNYGTAQLVLLGEYLKSQNFSLWNLGQPYMDYKIDLGAKVYEREAFLKKWFKKI